MPHAIRTLAAGALCALWASHAAAEICVENATEESFLFAVDAREGARRTARLAPGARLCAEGSGGFVSVFDHADAAEGCSRLVAPPGGLRRLHRYASFDRCAWDDNT